MHRDQMGRTVSLSSTPKRVVSLVPSITEYLVDLGVNVVGRTKFCIYPKESVSEIPIIGGTKNFRFSAIDDLKPDLIIGNKEENYKEGIDKLADIFPVWLSDILTIQDSHRMMEDLGELLGKKTESEHLISLLDTKLSKLTGSESGKVVYCIWKDPLMVAGTGTYINSFLTHLGFENAISEPRYPEISIEKLADLDPDLILLSSEPFPFKEKHVETFSGILPNAEIKLVNGEFYSWYGTRILKL